MNNLRVVSIFTISLAIFLIFSNQIIAFPGKRGQGPPGKDNSHNGKSKKSARHKKDTNSADLYEPPRQENRSDTLLICHSPPVSKHASDTATQKEKELIIRRSAWTGHKIHGDKKGPCSPFEAKKTLSFDSSEGELNDVLLDKDGNPLVAKTEKNLVYYDTTGEVKRKVSIDSRAYLNHLPTSTAVTFSLDGNFEYTLLDESGSPKSSGEIDEGGDFSPSGLVGDNLYASEGMTTYSKYDLESGSKIYEISAPPYSKFTYHQQFGYFELYNSNWDILHDTATGTVVQKVSADGFNSGYSQNGNYHYVATRKSFTTKLTVKKIGDRILSRWQNLPKKGVYNAEFFEPKSLLLSPLSTGKLFVGNFKTGEFEKVDYPDMSYTINNLAIDRSDGILFLSGFQYRPTNDDSYSLEKVTNRSRVIWAYDIKNREFIDYELSFSPSNYNFDSAFFGAPSMKVLDEKDTLGVSLQEAYKIYEYNFD